ncbi:MAG: protein kinase [Deltaproteobacteria bacterium]|nr:protein kinase [Deltaproteobacteria bacterium]
MNTPPELQTGAIFARQFRVLGRLAEGGMGVVYLVEQLSTRRQRALKVMQPTLVTEPKHRERFEQEAYVSALIDSDHIVEVVSAGIDTDTSVPFLAMELLRGQTLDDRIVKQGALTGPEALAVIRQLRHPLELAHTAGLIHRDLKPENIFLAVARRLDVPFTLKVLDFGISKWVQEARTAAANSQVIGSPYWMAPEQLEHGARIAPATDVWSLGLIAFYVLTGKIFWKSGNSDTASISSVIFEMIVDPIPPASKRAAELGLQIPISPAFDTWFDRCVQRKHEQRFLNAGVALRALEEVLDQSAVQTLVAPTTLSAIQGRTPTAPQPTPVDQLSIELELGTSDVESYLTSMNLGATAPRPAVVAPEPVLAAVQPPLPSVPPAPSSSPSMPPTRVHADSSPTLDGIAPRASVESAAAPTPVRNEPASKSLSDFELFARFESQNHGPDLDATRLTAQALFLRAGETTPGVVRAFLAANPPPAPIIPRGHLDESAWLNALLPDPPRNAPISRLFSLLCGPIHQAISVSPTALGLSERERVDPMTSAASVLRTTRPLHQWMLHAAAAFDVASMPTLYFRSAQTQLLQCMSTEPWAASLGAPLTRENFSPSALAALAGRHIALYRPEHFLRVVLPSLDALQSMFVAARSIARNQALTIEGPIEAALRQKFATDSARQKLLQLIEPCDGAELSLWARAAGVASVRAGLLLCGDLLESASTLAHHPGVETLSSESDLRSAMVDFALTPEFARLRRTLLGAAATGTGSR